MANYTLTHSLTNLSHGNVSFTVVSDTGYALPSAVSVSNGTLVSYDSSTGVIVVSGDAAEITVDCQSAIVIDPVLANNSWDIIKQVCQAGNAADYWALGDTKTDLGTDGVTRTFRICDMYNAYTGRVVFEQVELEANAIQWNPSNNVDDNSCSNNYGISNMRSTHLPALLAKYSSELQAAIPNTTYKVAKNGNSTTLLDLTDKLFLPAEREIFASRWGSVQNEWDALTRFALYALSENDNATFRIKKTSSSSSSGAFWWERSPISNNTDGVGEVTSSGSANYDHSYNSNRIAPCFAF